ncbi:MAG: hypothetical protein JSS02_30265 [Planctomycetes bacterium]|nr:hypothetical protein [Planctomycetota bacterium]
MTRPKSNSDRVELPAKFAPQFWTLTDQRSSVTKTIKRRVDELKRDCGADSVQKDQLVQRAVFVGLQLETMEVLAAETGEFDSGRYTQMLNTLLGLLKALGLERKAKKAKSLKAYLTESE